MVGDQTAVTEVAKERESEGDLFLGDMGQGVCFRPGTFDGVISVSALVCLCCFSEGSETCAPYCYFFFFLSLASNGFAMPTAEHTTRAPAWLGFSQPSLAAWLDCARVVL
jgi:hypothetical protein